MCALIVTNIGVATAEVSLVWADDLSSPIFKAVMEWCCCSNNLIRIIYNPCRQRVLHKIKFGAKCISAKLEGGGGGRASTYVTKDFARRENNYPKICGAKALAPCGRIHATYAWVDRGLKIEGNLILWN